MFFTDAARDRSNKIYRCAGGFSLISLVMGLGVGLLALELGVVWLGTARRQWHITAQSLLADRNYRTVFLTLKKDLNACGYRGLPHWDAHYPVVYGMEAESAPCTFNADLCSRLLPGSDMLEIADVPVAHDGKEATFPAVEQVSYFVARKARDPEQRYALWRRVKGENSEEILRGIKSFTVQYQELNAGACGEPYLPAKKIKDWSKVCRVCVTWTQETRPEQFSAEIGVGRVNR